MFAVVPLQVKELSWRVQSPEYAVQPGRYAALVLLSLYRIWFKSAPVKGAVVRKIPAMTPLRVKLALAVGQTMPEQAVMAVGSPTVMLPVPLALVPSLSVTATVVAKLPVEA
jgi:hypothetical protein